MSKRAALLTLVISAVMAAGPNINLGRINLGPVNVYAAEIIGTWDSGNTTVTIDSEGTLTVTAKPGTDGAMANHYVYPSPPWQRYLQNVKVINIESGVSTIGNYTFTDAGKVGNPLNINIADTVTQIGYSAFEQCDLKEVNIYSTNVTICGDAFSIDLGLYSGDKLLTESVINIYGNVTPGGSFINKVDADGGSNERKCTLSYKEGVEDIFIDAASYIEIPTTAKRIVGTSAYGNKCPWQITLMGDTYITYVADAMWGYNKIDNTCSWINKEYLHIPEDAEYLGNDLGLLVTQDIKITNPNFRLGEKTFASYPSSIELVCDIADIPNEAFNRAKGEIKLDWETIRTLGNSAFQDTTIDIRQLPFDKITTIGNKALAGIKSSELGLELDLSNTESIGEYAFSGSDIQKVTVGWATRVETSFANMQSLKEFVILPEATNTTFNFANSTLLERIYWLGPINSAQSVSKIPSTVTIYCTEGSTVETWCKNNNRAYKLLSDEEVDGIINGKLPTLQQDSFMYDGTVKKDINLTVTLGEKPAGASGISKVLIDNEQLSQDSWEFNGTDKITIYNTALAELTNGSHTISVLFDNDTFRSGATITVINSTHGNGSNEPPDALTTITYEFYKDYPDYVIIPVKLNGATEITRLRIGSNELTEDNYKLEDGAIIIDKDYVAGLEVGKYRVLPTFNDKDNTTIPNIMLRVYEKAADRAAPYLLQTRLVFSGQPIVLNFEPGEGDLQASNVLALILDDTIILPNGERLPFTKTNTSRIKEAYEASLDIDEPYVIDSEKEKEVAIATLSDATKEEDTIEPDKATPSEATPKDEIPEEETDTEEVDVATPSEATPKDKIPDEETDTEEEVDVATPSEAKRTKGLIDKAEATQEEKERLINIMAELEYSSDNVFTVEGTTITIDGDYIKSLNLSAGDHLIGAIFDNTERTTDIKKVILTIPDNENNPPDPDDKPDPTPDEKPTPNPTPDEKPDEKPTPNPTPDNGGNSGGNGGSSGGSGGSKPSGNGNGSNNSSNIPDTGGNWSGSGDDWTYIKPDGNTAHSEWVGDGNNWYYIDENGKLKFDWFQDPATGIWYMLNRDHNGTFGAALKGWYFEKQDNKWYYLSTINNKMLTGWQLINGEWYYLTAFNEGPTYFGDNINGWKFDTTKGQRPYGSLWVSETTPDGYKVNENGVWIK